MSKEGRKMTKKQSNVAIAIALSFFALVLAIAVIMNVKNTVELRGILENSVRDQLVSISMAAREMIDVDAFVEYDNEDVFNLPQYQETLMKLRALCKNAGAEYIYALKLQQGEYVFVFDTDEENEEIFISYPLSPVHERAFLGFASADIMNVDDEYGSFNTGAVPIYQGNTIVGIISTDIADQYLEKSMVSARINSIVLIVILVVTMGVMSVVVVKLFRRIGSMQQTLERQAHYDNVTGLPNRQYLMEYLAKAAASEGKAPFALFFVDIDNFKTVNDNAGHDAGDELLRHIAEYLDGALEHSKSFRPSAGQLNIAARIGGDEFVQVVHGVDNPQQAKELAQKLLDDFGGPAFDKYKEKYGVGLSIGVALYPEHSENYHVIIKYADVAMYNAKHGGKGNYCVYEEEMSKNAD